MALFRWLFGNQKKIPKKTFKSEIEDELKVFLRYIKLFESKKRAIDDIDVSWFKGRINNVIYQTKQVMDIIRNEMRKEKKERRIINHILHSPLSSDDQIPSVEDLEDIISRLFQNLNLQLKLLKNFSEHQDINKIDKDLKELVHEEQSLLFGEREVLERLLHAIERLEAAEKLKVKGAEFNYDVWMTEGSKIERVLCFKFDNMISNLSKLGEPVNILDIGCDVGMCLKQLYQRYGNVIGLYGLGKKRMPLWASGLRDTKKATLRRGISEQAKERLLRKFVDTRPWRKDAISWHVGHAEMLSRIFQSEMFHLIYSHHGILHSNNLVRALQESQVVLKKGGIIVFDLSEEQKKEVELKLKGFKIIKSKHIFGSSVGGNEIMHLLKI